VTGYLIDTNVVSEWRKGPRADRGVTGWFRSSNGDDMHLSVLTAGEFQNGIERLRRRDAQSAVVLEAWLSEVVDTFEDRILPVDLDVTRVWATLGVPDPVPVIDGLLAATARCHGLTMVTRNVTHFRAAGVDVLNPFSD
jgi:predicted nucleic acid-binding protein